MPVTDAEARSFVADYYGQRAADVSPLGAGEWSRAYAVVLDGRAAVIRFGDHVEDFRKDEVMAAHSCAAMPVPAIIEIGPADDGYFAVSERALGQLLDGLDGPEMHGALPGLLAALDVLRDIDVAGTEGYGIWPPDGPGPAASWAQALLAISHETTRIPGWRAALAVRRGLADLLVAVVPAVAGDRHYCRTGEALGPARGPAARPAPPAAGLPGPHRPGRHGLQRLPRPLG